MDLESLDPILTASTDVRRSLLDATELLAYRLSSGPNHETHRPLTNDPFPWFTHRLSEISHRAITIRRISYRGFNILVQQALAVMGDSLADSTIGQYATTWHQLEIFSWQGLGVPPSPETSVLFLQYRQQHPISGENSTLSVQSAHQYGRRIIATALHMKLNWDLGSLRTYLTGLTNYGALVPTQQAETMTQQFFWEKWEQITIIEHKWILWLMWKTCSRADDIQKLKTANLRRFQGYLLVIWDARPVTSRKRRRFRLKADVHGLGHAVMVSDQNVSEVLTYLSMLRTELLTQLTTPQISHLVQQYFGDQFTAHSIKHSVTNLLIDLGFEERLIRYMTKHKILGEESSSFRTYIRPERLAMMFKTHVLTQEL